MPKIDWHPSASVDAIKARAELYALIRSFFAQRGVLEVETPLLGTSNSLDINLEPFRTQFGQRQPLVLQTSPEFFMKRMLSAGVGCMYQICKAFRDEEHGRKHNPEFTMLEWYRLCSLDSLIAEVEALLQLILGDLSAERVTYESLFTGFALNPHTDSDNRCIEVALSNGAPAGLNKQASCDYLFDLGLAKLSQDTLYVVVDFPAWQAMLAKVDTSGPVPVARRFEFFYKGIELANGYDELQSATEQRQRFEHEASQRANMGKPELKFDEKFLGALDSLPDCSGVAMGLDRLLMLKLGKDDISDVIAFGYESL